MYEKTQTQEKISLQKLLELVRKRRAIAMEGEETGKMYIVTTDESEMYEVVVKNNEIMINRIQEIRERTRNLMRSVLRGD